ncbi:MAG TPA: RNA polymerase factor sigma-54 [Acidobacteriaceae bacterium]|nr:RNA polymerase factor sigma-54 [Acidobacteriaceae bacterium]
MVLLQPKLSLKVAQRQILTPGLMQMVSVLALNKLELKEMINAEIVENPVLEELEENVPMLEDLAGREADRDRSAQEIEEQSQREKQDPFDEIDFGSYFQDYLDPGFRTPNSFELSEKPSFENFLSQPGTLSDHLCWQLGSLSVSPELRNAAEYVIGNLDEDGYLIATEEELLSGFLRERTDEAAPELTSAASDRSRVLLADAVKLVQNLDPVGVATPSLRECLLVQIEAQRRDFQLALARRKRSQQESSADVERTERTDGSPSGSAAATAAAAEPASSHVPECQAEKCRIFALAARIVDQHLAMLQKRDLREMSKVLGKPADAVQAAIDFIRTLDPRPGQRYNRSEARLIEPDVAFVKRGDEYVVVMNEEDLPTLRLNQGYRKLLSQDGTEKEVKDYVKERYRSALQLMRNIDQRKNTILRTCEAIVRRQTDFLEQGVEALKPMMIKDVAEEIGVHPSTVSRAVSSKYVHTSQGVFELRFFFSEGVNGPEGSTTPLMLLKRKVKKLIEEEDPRKPLTDDLIATMLQTQGIDVTRRTVAKYREDLRIPSTHQRRVRD